MKTTTRRSPAKILSADELEALRLQVEAAKAEASRLYAARLMGEDASGYDAAYAEACRVWNRYCRAEKAAYRAGTAYTALKADLGIA